MKAPSIPFRICVLAPFLGRDCPVWKEAPLAVDLSDLDHVIEKLGPTCTIPMPNDLVPEGKIEIRFSRLKNFHPDDLIQNQSYLKNLFESKGLIEQTQRKNLSPGDVDTHLNKILKLSETPVNIGKKELKGTSGDQLDSILDMVALPDKQTGESIQDQGSTKSIDVMLRQILDLVFQDESFRAMEESWYGLKLLLGHLNMRESDTKVDIVPVCHDTLDETLENLTAELIDTLPSLILIDLPFDSSARSTELLKKISSFSETLLVPAITWISPAFFNINSWEDLKKLSFLPHYLEESSFAKWQSLKKTSSANWLTVTCNRFISRYPYGKDNPTRTIQLKEHDPTWASPVWALAGLIGQSVVKTGWPTRFTDWQNIQIEDLPLNMENPKNPLPVEMGLNRDRADQFIRSCISPLMATPGKDIVFFPTETTVGGASLAFQLFMSRIAQLVFWCRDNFEKGIAGSALEAELQDSFRSFWEHTGHMGPDSLVIKTGQPDGDNRIPVRIVLEPSREILASRQRLEMDFMW